MKTRTAHAVRLLARGQSAIQEIALQCGFSGQNALSRQYRQLLLGADRKD